MAIVQFGATVTGLRGTVGGLTFSANGSGAYAKSWRMPSLKESTLQTKWRSSLGRYGALWRALTAAQRADWRTWAAAPAQARSNSLGETYYMTGYQAYAAYNNWRAAVGYSVRSAAPTASQPAAPASTTLSAFRTGGTYPSQIGYPASSYDPYETVIFAALVNSVGVLDAAPVWKQVFAGFRTGISSCNIQVGLEAAMGTVRVGQRLLVVVHWQAEEGYRGLPLALQGNVS